MSQTGFVFVATGSSYHGELEAAVASLRGAMPSAHVSAVVDREYGGGTLDERVVLERPRYSFIDKVEGLLAIPYERTIYLDTDTHVCGDLGELFELLDSVEFAYVHAPQRYTRTRNKDGSVAEERWQPPGVPDCFTQPNSGVMAFRNCRAVQKVFREWLRIYRKQRKSFPRPGQDQAALQQALYESRVHTYVLPTEFNLRTNRPATLSTRVRVLHGRPDDFLSLEREVNQLPEALRVFLPGVGTFTAEELKKSPIPGM
ncbi:MAG: hypothetical protein V2A76_15920 [Planctomycetota bacterium]